MREAFGLLFAWTSGVVLGTIFFGGLWWTVRKAVASPWPAMWLLSSLALRMGLTLVSLYLVAGHGLSSLLACLVGMISARMGVMRITGHESAVLSGSEAARKSKEASLHAS